MWNNNKHNILLTISSVLIFLSPWPAFAIKQLPSHLDAVDACNYHTPPLLDFRETGFSKKDDPNYSGWLFYIDIPVEDTSDPHLTGIAVALLNSGWEGRGGCINPREYWVQYSIEQTAYFPAVFSKLLPSGSGPKTNGAQCTTTGNPINITNGNKYQTETDIASSTSSGISFARYYNSNTSFAEGGIGRGWTHTYSINLSPLTFNNSTEMGVNRENGKLLHYRYEENLWVSDPDITQKLENIVDNDNNHIGWRYIKSDSRTEEYDLEGKLSRIIYTNGNIQQLSYDEQNRLSEVLNQSNGSYIRFHYDANNRINSITDQDNNSWTYQYDGTGRLIAVGNPDGTSRQYHYEDTTHATALTGITDENGNRYATWAYDDQGRAISSEHANGVDRTILDYTNLEDTTDPRVTVTNPLGKDTTYHFTTIHGVRKVTQVEGHPTASCEGANKSYNYDANGNVISKTDWKGVVTNYTYDMERNLELTRTEAVGTPQERTIATEWHTDFRLPTKIIEPGKITEYTYDTQGRQLSSKVSSVQ